MVTLPTLNQVQGLPDPAENWAWTADILIKDVILVSALRVLEVNFPFSYIESTPRPRAGSFLYFPGHSNIDGTTVSFYETQDFSVLRAFKYWQSLIKDDDGNYGLPMDYLGEVILRNFDSQGKVRLETVLAGCWPARLSDWQLTYQGSNHLTVQVQFSVNDSEFRFINATGIEIVTTSIPSI